MPRICLLITTLLLAAAIAAEEVSVTLSPGVPLDEAGRALRMAINAYEEALLNPLPDAWSHLTMSGDESLSLGDGTFLLIMQARAREATIMFIDQEGPHQASLAPGTDLELGAARVILVSTREGGPVELMLRARERVPLLLPTKPGRKSNTRISGISTPPEIVVETPSPEIAEFARVFLQSYNRSRDALSAAAAARDALPMTISSLPVSESQGQYVDPVNIMREEEPSYPTAALVTLHLVRGESNALKALSSRIDYQSDGRASNDPNVRVSGGAGGLGVQVGRAGDRFRGRLRALESQGRATSESETFLRVPLGGDALLGLSGPQGHLDAWLAARPSGQGVLLEIDQRSGDWSFLGGISTSVRVRNGETVTLARHASSRTTSASSGPPLISGLPFVGPMVGSSISRQEETHYALFATVEME